MCIAGGGGDWGEWGTGKPVSPDNPWGLTEEQLKMLKEAAKKDSLKKDILQYRGGEPPEGSPIRRKGYGISYGDVPIEPYSLPEGQIPKEWYVAPPTELEQMAYGKARALSPYYYGMMEPAVGFYGDILRGAYSPYGEYFRRKVYEPTKEEAFVNLERAQKEMARKFASQGGYFGGKHALAEAELARGTISDLNRLLAELELRGYEEDIASKFRAAEGMRRVPSELRGLEWGDIEALAQLGGRERGMYQAYLDAVRRDWERARREEMLPFEMALSLLGVRAFEPVMMEPQPSPWAYLLGGLGSGLGSFLPLKLLGKWL